ncbi:caspase-like [Drosophila ficusphila]|uniref:caspase-like n=1 Tax=Drosophila ficusphila TaxID=30025 RepID=UPI0007E839D5|nr:caspase-like [Drosophila ficusphila]
MEVIERPAVPSSNISQQKLQPPYVCILNHEDFSENPGLNRKGSSKDVEALHRTFKKLNCQIEDVSNPTFAKVQDTMEKLSEKNFDNLAGVVIVILSHGKLKEKILTCDSKNYDLDEHVLFKLNENETLKRKHKILIVQACKGGWEMDAAYEDGSQFMKCYSTTEGFVSYRNRSTGSIYIQTLCAAMDQDALKKDFKLIIEDVNEKVEKLAELKGINQKPSISYNKWQPLCFGHFVNNVL